MTPSVGRVVHLYGPAIYVRHGSSELFCGPYAATITFVHNDGTVNLRYDYPWPDPVAPHVASALHEHVIELRSVAAEEGLKTVRLTGKPHFWIWPPRVG